MPSRAPKNTDLVTDDELGTTGLAHCAGIIDEEWNRQLQGTRAPRMYREMRDNDPVIGAIFFIIEYLLVQQPWHVEPGEGKRKVAAKKFVEKAMKELDVPWATFIQEAISALQYGWFLAEICYKVNEEGELTWSKFAPRAQETLDRWEIKDNGDIEGMWQSDFINADKTVFIPINKALLIRTTSAKNNPEGRSILRSATRPYYFLKRIQEMEAIGIERDLAGIPVLTLPAELMLKTANAEILQQRAAYKKMLQQLRRDEREGIILPAEIDKDGKPTGFKLSLLSTGGKRAIDTNAIIIRYEQRIAMSLLAQFLLLGSSSGGGGYALADKQAGLFTSALQNTLQIIADALNTYAIPTLCSLNGFTRKECPTVRPELLQDVSLQTVAAFVNQCVAANIIEPDDELEEHVRKLADFPKKGKPRPRPEELNPLQQGAPKEGDPTKGNKENNDAGSKDPADLGDGERSNVRTERTATRKPRKS